MISYNFIKKIDAFLVVAFCSDSRDAYVSDSKLLNRAENGGLDTKPYLVISKVALKLFGDRIFPDNRLILKARLYFLNYRFCSMSVLVHKYRKFFREISDHDDNPGWGNIIENFISLKVLLSS